MKKFDRIAPETPYDGATIVENVVPGGLHFMGVLFDETACFRKGTRHGPRTVREYSPHYETWSPYLELDAEEMEPLYDLGDFTPSVSCFVKEGAGATLPIFESFDLEGEERGREVRILTVGGEHSISYGPIVSMLRRHPDLCVLHLDAHADLRDGYEGYHYSHASVIRRVLDHFGEGHTLIQGLIRSGTREEFALMERLGSLAPTMTSLLERFEAIPIARPIYLTFDLDWFDPAFMPGTGTPEPGGQAFTDFVLLLRALKGRRIVGCDVVELSPEHDPAGISAALAAKVVRELFLLLSSY